MVDAARACAGTRRDGTPCKGQALPSSELCWAHDPASQDRVKAARSAGGKARSKAARADKLMPAAMRPIFGCLLKALLDTRDGTLTPQQGTAMASIAGALVKTYSVGQLEERLAALEEVAQAPVAERRRA